MAASSLEDEARVAYALIDQIWGLPPSNDGKSSPFSLRSPSNNDESAANGVSPVSLTTMDQWYEYFAVRTPSNGYLARVEEVENDRVRQLQAKKESKSGGGWFSRLFGRSGGEKSALGEKNEANETECEPDENVPQQLKLDVNAINHEARTFHRFHLASEQRALVSPNNSGGNDEHSVALPVRISVGWDDIESTSDANKQTHLCIVGYGQIAEFPSLPETSFASLEQHEHDDTDNMQTNQNIDAAKISLTSDHNELLSFVTKLDKEQPLPLYDLRHCRAASIGSDCIIVSWGLGGDGSIVFYRRIETQRSPRNKRVGFENVPAVGWVAVAYATPSDSVIEAALHNMTPDPCFSGGYKHRQQEHNVSRLYELGSLRVTDMVPMVFNNSNSSSAMLAISRLGGFVELLSLPSWIWLDKLNVPPRTLIDLSAASNVSAFSTSIHHTDILAIDAYRTRFGIGKRDETNRAPLAEFVMVASGQPSVASQDGQQFDDSAFSGAALSFWCIAVIQSNDQRGAGIDLGVTCIQRCDINNLGAGSSIFVTTSTVDYWSEPTRNEDIESVNRRRKQYTPSTLSIISTHVPITSLRFAPCPSPESNMKIGVLLAALDCNGGVTVLDCSQCIYSVEHFNVHDLANGMDALKNHTQIVLLTSREASMITQSNEVPSGTCRASQIEWWRSPSLFAAANNDQCHDQSLVDPGSLGTFYLATNTLVQGMQRNNDSFNGIRLQKWNLSSSNCSDSIDPIEVLFVPMSRQNTATMLLPMKCQTFHETLTLLELASHQLSVCGVRKFTDPSEIISVLLHQSRPARALDVARGFGGAKHFGNAIVNKCQIQLWEEQRNVEALKLVSIHEYVVREALHLDKSLKAGATSNVVTMGHLIDIYREALWRLDELKSESHSVDLEWLSGSATQLRKSLRLVGTFELLMQHFADNGKLDESFETTSFVTRFLHGFCHCDLVDVASSAASRGDIDALTIILARHPSSTRMRMNLLELIPLEVDFSFYEHLLPCSADGVQKDGLFLPKSQIGLPKQYLDTLEMFLFLVGGKLPVFINEADEDLTIKLFQDDSEVFGLRVADLQASKEDVAFWYLKTCLSIHKNTRDIEPVKRFCELALVRLGFVSFAENGTYEISALWDLSFCDESSSVCKLVYLYYAADLLNRITADKVKGYIIGPQASTHDWTEAEVFLSIKQFCSMNTSDALSFLLDNAGPSNAAFFENFIAHFVFGKECLAPSGNGVIKTDAKSDGLQYDAIVELCLDKVLQARSRKRKTDADSPNDVFKLQQALSACAMFASFASNEWSEDELVSFACQVFNCTIRVVGEEWSTVLQRVIDHLWSIFEALPSTSLSNLQTKHVVLHLQLRLVVIQMCSKWGRHQHISHSLRSFARTETGSHDNEELTAVAFSDLLKIVARGFCEYAVGQNGHGRDLLLDFISDVSEIDRQYFSSYAEESGSVGAIVLPLFLKQGLFIILAELLRVRPGWFCRDRTRAALLSYIRASEHEMQSNSASMKCLDALGPLFPELAIEVERQHRFRDAKMFAKNEMRMDNEMLALFFSGQHSSPISVTKALLSSYPESLMIGCEFWSDQMGSERACADAASYFLSQIDAITHQAAFDESSHVLPPMPGALVMQLSNILGHLDSLEALRLKQLMVIGVLKLGFAHAAIAICFSMLCDAAFARQKSDENMTPGAKWTNEHEDIVLHCVISSISGAPSNNAQIKKDLCAQSLRLFRAHTSHLQNTLLGLFSSLEYEEIGNRTAVDSHVSSESADPSRHQSEFLVFKAAELVAKQAKDFVEHSVQPRTAATPNPFYELSLVFNEVSKDSGMDIGSLRSSFRTSSNADEVNQELSDLSQVFFNWAVECAFKLTNHSALSAAKMRMIVELGASCLAALTNAKTAALVIDMGIEEFKAASASKSDAGSVQPDPALAQRLHERGYGWNAARRACIMVNNQGYSEALGWAVAHFQDADFDSPLFILNNGDSESLSQDLISLVGGLLQSIKARHESSKNTGMKQVPIKTASARPACDASRNERKTLLASNRHSSSVATPTSEEISLADKIQTESVSKDTSAPAPPPLNSSVPSLAPDLTKKVCAPPAKQSVPRLQTGMSPSQLNPFLRTPTNDATLNSTGRVPNSGDSMSMSSFDGSLGSRASIKRQVNNGKVIGTKNLSADDRKRLASEGRRLLELARSKNKSVMAPPTSIVTKPFPRP